MKSKQVKKGTISTHCNNSFLLKMEKILNSFNFSIFSTTAGNEPNHILKCSNGQKAAHPAALALLDPDPDPVADGRFLYKCHEQKQNQIPFAQGGSQQKQRDMDRPR